MKVFKNMKKENEIKLEDSMSAILALLASKSLIRDYIYLSEEDWCYDQRTDTLRRNFSINFTEVRTRRSFSSEDNKSVSQQLKEKIVEFLDALDKSVK